MTFNELKSEVSALGFDASINSAELFTCSVNRALRDLYTRKSILKTVRLYSNGQKPSVCYKEIYCKNGQSKTFPLEGRAYSMRLCGEGYYAIYDGSSTNIFQFNSGSESKLVRGFISVGGTIRFYGSVSFTVYDLSFYDEIYVTSSADIPDGTGKKTFDLRKIYQDFLSFVSPAADPSGRPVKGAVLADGKLTVPAEYKGEILLTYRRLPDTVVNNTSQNIDVPEEYSHLFPLLVAFYMWLDVDEDKALYYKEQYEKVMELSDKESYESLDFSYIDTNGWA